MDGSTNKSDAPVNPAADKQEPVPSFDRDPKITFAPIPNKDGQPTPAPDAISGGQTDANRNPYGYRQPGLIITGTDQKPAEIQPGAVTVTGQEKTSDCCDPVRNKALFIPEQVRPILQRGIDSGRLVLDPNTNLFFDYGLGHYYNPQRGQYLNPRSGQFIDPDTDASGNRYDNLRVNFIQVAPGFQIQKVRSAANESQHMYRVPNSSADGNAMNDLRFDARQRMFFDPIRKAYCHVDPQHIADETKRVYINQHDRSYEPPQIFGAPPQRFTKNGQEIQTQRATQQQQLTPREQELQQIKVQQEALQRRQQELLQGTQGALQLDNTGSRSASIVDLQHNIAVDQARVEQQAAHNAFVQHQNQEQQQIRYQTQYQQPGYANYGRGYGSGYGGGGSALGQIATIAGIGVLSSLGGGGGYGYNNFNTGYGGYGGGGTRGCNTGYGGYGGNMMGGMGGYGRGGYGNMGYGGYGNNSFTNVLSYGAGNMIGRALTGR